MKFVVIAILVFFAFQFIFRFLIPVILATRKVKRGFREMKDRMEQQMQQQQGYQNQTVESKPKQSPPKSDYIEFEEIK